MKKILLENGLLPELRGTLDKKIRVIAGRDMIVCEAGRDGTKPIKFCVPPTL
jgi:hypothetical protein